MQRMGFRVLPSQANFIFVSHESYSAEFLYTKLKEDGILVRHFNKQAVVNYLRITIGTDMQMNKLLLLLCKIIR